MRFIALRVSIVCSIVAAIAVSQPAQAGTVSAVCKPARVGIFNNRFHVKCDFPAEELKQMGNAPEGVPLPYYAIEANSPLVANMLQIATAALVNKRWLTVYFDDNSGNTPTGCDKSDCRRLVALELR